MTVEEIYDWLSREWRDEVRKPPNERKNLNYANNIAAIANGLDRIIAACLPMDKILLEIDLLEYLNDLKLGKTIPAFNKLCAYPAISWGQWEQMKRGTQ